MSALATPFIHSSRATGTVQPINGEKVLSFEKLETPSINNQPSKFEIIFSMEAGAAPQNVVWSYATEVLLDADMVQILILLSTVTP